jgi:hypothetical protein
MQQQQQQRYQEEAQAAKVQLYCPGQLWHLTPPTGAGLRLSGATDMSMMQRTVDNSSIRSAAGHGV